MNYTVKQATEIVGVSNTTLKRYEQRNLIPPVTYTKGGQRRYQDIHITAFITLRKLLKGFEIPIAYQLMAFAIEGQFNQANWIIAKEQKKLVENKELLERHREFLLAFPSHSKVIHKMRIGELAKYAKVETSAIRYWEERNLIESIRDNSNGYRYYESHEIRKTVVISFLRKTIYDLEEIRKVVDGIKEEDFNGLKKHYSMVIQNNEKQLATQLEAISFYVQYCHDLQAN